MTHSRHLILSLHKLKRRLVIAIHSTQSKLGTEKFAFTVGSRCFVFFAKLRFIQIGDIQPWKNLSQSAEWDKPQQAEALSWPKKNALAAPISKFIEGIGGWGAESRRRKRKKWISSSLNGLRERLSKYFYYYEPDRLIFLLFHVAGPRWNVKKLISIRVEMNR